MGNTKLARAEHGTTPVALARRKEVFAARARGLSYRAIAKELGTTIAVVRNDLAWVDEHWGDQSENSREAIRAQLVETLRSATTSMLRDIEQQSQNGQRVVACDGQGIPIGSQAKQWINPASVAELGRCCERIGKIMGLMDSGIDAGQQQAAVVVNLPAPTTGAEWPVTGAGSDGPAIDAAAK